MNKKNLLSTLKQFLKFGIVGISNTLVTISTIFILMSLMGVSYIISNIVGYILGLINSFILNKIWTFKSRATAGKEGIRFVLVFGICYLIQLAALIFLKEKVGVTKELAQLLAMIIYTMLNFTGNKLYTFRK